MSNKIFLLQKDQLAYAIEYQVFIKLEQFAEITLWLKILRLVSSSL